MSLAFGFGTKSQKARPNNTISIGGTTTPNRSIIINQEMRKR